MKQEVTVELSGGKTITFETGRLAKQAHGSVLAKNGDNYVLATAVANQDPREGIDFFPLTVDYREYTYAGGRIPGGFIKREGRPSEREVLTSRLIDRPIRPLFAEGFKCETQVVAMVQSADSSNDPDIIGINAASAALHVSAEVKILFWKRGLETMRKKKGFSLIELLIVVAIILIIAAIAIPNLLRSRMAANEASAVGTLRSLVSAEATYQLQNPTVGYSADLTTLGNLLGSIPTDCKKNGYTCTYAPGTESPVATFTILNDPDVLDTTGTRSFFVNQIGAIHAKSGTGCADTDPLLQ